MSITTDDRCAGEPLKKVATHTTNVSLYLGRATMVRVFTSFIMFGVISGLLIPTIDVSFISQLIASAACLMSTSECSFSVGQRNKCSRLFNESYIRYKTYTYKS